MDKSNGQIWNNGQIMDKNDLKWILNGLNGNHTLEILKLILTSFVYTLVKSVMYLNDLNSISWLDWVIWL